MVRDAPSFNGLVLIFGLMGSFGSVLDGLRCLLVWLCLVFLSQWTDLVQIELLFSCSLCLLVGCVYIFLV